MYFSLLHLLLPAVVAATTLAVSEEDLAASRFAPSTADFALHNSLASNCTPATSPPFNTQDWQVPWMGTYSPSGRPNTISLPYIEFGFFDPNTCFSTNCTKIWNATAGEVAPSDYVPCDDPAVEFKVVGRYISDNFTMEIEYNFVDSANETVIETGTNLYQLTGECGGSGACFWGLNGNTQYVPVVSS